MVRLKGGRVRKLTDFPEKPGFLAARRHPRRAASAGFDKIGISAL